VRFLLKFLSLFLYISVGLLASSPYYEHKVSQFKLLSDDKTKSIVMLGDSITERGLWSELTNRMDIANRGISGDTTEGVMDRLNNLNPNFKQCFIMLGINDILRGEDILNIMKNYKNILNTLRQKNITPYIQSTLYIGSNAPYLYKQRVKKLNQFLQRYAKEHKLVYIDLNKSLAPNSYLKQNYSLDGLHLNGEGYLIWKNIITKHFIQVKAQ